MKTLFTAEKKGDILTSGQMDLRNGARIRCPRFRGFIRFAQNITKELKVEKNNSRWVLTRKKKLQY